MMRSTVCCIFNIGPHYRAPIYKLMDQELKCDFYFGDRVESPIKLMDYTALKGYKKTVTNKKVLGTGFVWQTSIWKLVFKPYEHYIISSNETYLSNWILLLVGKILGKKIYPWSHGMKGVTKGRSKFLKKYFYKLSEKTLLYGQYAKNYMIEEGFKEDKLVLINNSLDYDLQIGILDSLSKSDIYTNYFGNKYPVIIYIGRLQKRKKLDLLVRALEKLNKNGVHCNLVFIGKDVDNSNIQVLVEDLKLQEHVWFYGPSYDEKEIGELLFNAHVCVSPGPIGLTAIHAATYGLPIVTNDDFIRQMPEHEIIEHGKTGSFFKNDNFQDLCNEIERWIKIGSQDRIELRKKVQQRVKQGYNPKYQMEVLKKLLQK